MHNIIVNEYMGVLYVTGETQGDTPGCQPKGQEADWERN